MDQALEEVDKFTYLGSVIAVDGGTEEDVKTKIGKARTSFKHPKHDLIQKHLT